MRKEYEYLLVRQSSAKICLGKFTLYYLKYVRRLIQKRGVHKLSDKASGKQNPPKGTKLPKVG